MLHPGSLAENTSRSMPTPISTENLEKINSGVQDLVQWRHHLDGLGETVTSVSPQTPEITQTLTDGTEASLVTTGLRKVVAALKLSAEQRASRAEQKSQNLATKLKNRSELASSVRGARLPDHAPSNFSERWAHLKAAKHHDKAVKLAGKMQITRSTYGQTDPLGRPLYVRGYNGESVRNAETGEKIPVMNDLGTPRQARRLKEAGYSRRETKSELGAARKLSNYKATFIKHNARLDRMIGNVDGAGHKLKERASRAELKAQTLRNRASIVARSRSGQSDGFPNRYHVLPSVRPVSDRLLEAASFLPSKPLASHGSHSRE